jgi:hypothetical protein
VAGDERDHRLCYRLDRTQWEWRTESRSNARAELADVEKRLATLTKPSPPRPIATITEALSGERVPPNVWRNSHECERIRSSRYFAPECSKILELRQELAAANDYERLEARAKELRDALSTIPIVAVQDPLPRAFAATVGRVAKVDGEIGIANLLTLIIEIISCFGLACLRVLWSGGQRDKSRAHAGDEQLSADRGGLEETKTDPLRTSTDIIPDAPVHPSAQLSLTPSDPTNRPVETKAQVGCKEPPSNILPLLKCGRRTPPCREARRGRQSDAARLDHGVDAHVRDFAEAGLRAVTGTSIGASELMAAYRDWCMRHGIKPLTQQNLGARLTALGFTRSKSCGLVRYRDVQIAA